MFKRNKNRMFSGGRVRGLVLGTLFIILAGVLAYRLFALQIIRGEDYLTNFALSI